MDSHIAKPLASVIALTNLYVGYYLVEQWLIVDTNRPAFELAKHASLLRAPTAEHRLLCICDFGSCEENGPNERIQCSVTVGGCVFTMVHSLHMIRDF